MEQTQYEVPEIWKAALAMIDGELSRVQMNLTQSNYPSPFSNTGNSYKNDTFEVFAYDWSIELSDDAADIFEQPYNFKWKSKLTDAWGIAHDVEISWYKYFGRGMTANKELDSELASVMLIECLQSIRKEDVVI